MAQDVATSATYQKQNNGRNVASALSGNNAEAVLRLFNSVVKPSRLNWNSLWANCTRFVWPEMEYFERDPVNTTPGQRRTPRLYDSTGTAACEQFPSIIEGLMIPRNQKWHGLEPPMWTGLSKNYRVRQYCEAVTSLLFAARYDSQANFVNTSTETSSALGAWGTGVFYIEARDGRTFPILYRPCALWEMYGIEGEDGIIDDVFRYFPMTVHQLLQKKKWLAFLPDEVFDLAEKDPNRKFFVLQRTRRLTPDEEPNARKRVYNCYYFEQNKMLLEEEYMRSWPWIFPRIAKMPTETYGRSPLMRVLPVVQSLQEIMRSFVRQSELMAEPPLGVAEEDSIGPVSLMPAAINFGAVSPEGRMLVQPIQATGQIQVTENMIQFSRQEVKEAFFLDFLQVIKDNPDMTATAVMEITSQRGQMLTPIIGRLQHEWLQPQIERELDILAEYGLLPDMPDELRAVGGIVEPRYDNLLSKAQRANEALAIVRVGQYVAEVAGFDPSIADNFDGDEAVSEFADIQGAPVGILRDPKAVASMRDARAQQQQMQTALGAAEPISKSIDNLASANVKAAGVGGQSI
jgi:hypothetical protein